MKQIDSVSRENADLVVMLITNRVSVLDPAIMRRTSLHLKFKRPNAEERRKVFEYLFNELKVSEKDIQKLVEASSNDTTPFTYSDLINRVGKQAVFRAIQHDKPFGPSVYLDVLEQIHPTPLIE